DRRVAVSHLQLSRAHQARHQTHRRYDTRERRRTTKPHGFGRRRRSLQTKGPRIVIEESVIQRVLAAGMSTGADFAEVFAEGRRSASAVLDDGKVEELTSGRDRGAGIRVVVGDATGFAHTSDLSESSLVETAKIAAAAAKGAGSGRSVTPLAAVDAPAPN